MINCGVVGKLLGRTNALLQIIIGAHRFLMHTTKRSFNVRLTAQCTILEVRTSVDLYGEVTVAECQVETVDLQITRRNSPAREVISDKKRNSPHHNVTRYSVRTAMFQNETSNHSALG